MATPEASVHPVKNRLCYPLAVYAINESCSQRCSRRIMMLRNLIKILVASYSSNVTELWEISWTKISSVIIGVVGYALLELHAQK